MTRIHPWVSQADYICYCPSQTSYPL